MISRLDALLAEARRRVYVSEYSADAVAFAGAVGITPDAWQERVLRWTGKRLLLNCSRQAGKSTTTSVLALHRALFTPRALILLISPSLRQSAELFRKVTDALGRLPVRPAMPEENKLSLQFANGSRIVSLPSSEATIRGFSAVSLIIEDEAAFVDDGLHAALRPMLAVSDGQLVLMSTPNGRRGHFFEAWERGGEAWERVQVKGYDVPRIARSFLDEERRALGERFRQEYGCEFVNAATGLVYAGFDERRNTRAELPPLQHHLLGLDFGIVDQNAVCVLGWRDHDRLVYVVEAYRRDAGVADMADEVKKLDKSYAFERVVGDLGGLGKAFADDMRRRHAVPIAAAAKHDKAGNISLVNDALRRGEIVLGPKCKHLVEEWTTLPWADAIEDRRENRQREAPGYPNHAADAFLYAWRAAYAYLEEPAKKKPTPAEREAEEERAVVAEHERENAGTWWDKAPKDDAAEEWWSR